MHVSLQVNDVRDLIRLLAEHPEWRAELRPLILGDELDRLPAIVAELAEAQRRTEARVEELAEAQRRTETRLSELAATVDRLVVRVDALAESVDRLSVVVRDLQQDTGVLYEARFERKAPSLFGQWLRRPRVVSLSDLDRFDEAEAAGQLSQREVDALQALDLIVVGGDKGVPGFPETLLAVEISRTLDVDDLDRADERAKILASIGYRSRAAVGGRFAPTSVQDLAARRDIILRLVEEAR